MKIKKIKIENIPVIIWGEESDKVYIFVHGKMGNKEEAKDFAGQCINKGYQVLSFDLLEHGERKASGIPNNIWNGIDDLKNIYQYTQKNWKIINLYAISIGAFYSLMSYQNSEIQKCLFVSPVVDMKKLIENMMMWTNVDEAMLKEERIIQTDFGEILEWDYYTFVKENPIKLWNMQTSIFYGMKDNLVDYETISEFSSQFNCKLSLHEDMDHFIYKEEDLKVLRKWQSENI